MLLAVATLLSLSACGGTEAVTSTTGQGGTSQPDVTPTILSENGESSRTPEVPEARLYVPDVPARPGALIEVRILASTPDPIRQADLEVHLDPGVLQADPSAMPSQSGRLSVKPSVEGGVIHLEMTATGDCVSFDRSTLISLPVRVAPTVADGTRTEIRVRGTLTTGHRQSCRTQEGVGKVLVQSEKSARALDEVRLQLAPLSQNDARIYESGALYQSMHSTACLATDYLVVLRVTSPNRLLRRTDFDTSGYVKRLVAFTVGGSVSQETDHIKTWLASGRPVIVGANSPAASNHWVLITGFSGNQLLAHDPWTGAAYVPLERTTRYSTAWGTRFLSAQVPTSQSVVAVGQGSGEQQHFVDCYNRNGGQSVVGSPVDNGGGAAAHWWGGQVVLQDFDGGSAGRGAIIDNEGTAHSTAWYLHGAIWQKYAAMGGYGSPLGRPASDEWDAARSPQGTGPGRLTRFENGTMYSSSRGTVPVYGVLSQKFEAAGGTAGPYGFPVGEPYVLAAGVKQQDFEGGTITELPGNAPGWVGAGSSEPAHFADCWSRNGRESDIGNALGGSRWWGTARPVVIQDFDGGSRGLPVSIIDNQGISHTTAWCLFGAIRDKYLSLGGPDSPLGRPKSDSWNEGPSPQGSSGRVQDFDGPGQICKSGRGTFAVYGTIFNKFNAQGRTLGPLGFPTSDPYYSGAVLKQSFEGGLVDSNLPPNPPVGLLPADNTVSDSRMVTFSWADGGDPDNLPQPCRNYVIKVRNPDGTTAAQSGTISSTTWTWTAPSAGTWRWQVKAQDGLADSALTPLQTITVR